jgi:hypothetical protein
LLCIYEQKTIDERTTQNVISQVITLGLGLAPKTTKKKRACAAEWRSQDRKILEQWTGQSPPKPQAPLDVPWNVPRLKDPGSEEIHAIQVSEFQYVEVWVL